ncbi:MAG: helix-turn-helix domain-containing protein [Saccharofermentanales bacterium]
MYDISKKRNEIIKQMISARISQNMTQAELAARMGTQRSNICRLETGRQNISVDLLIKAAQALGMELNVRLTGKEDAPVSNSYQLRVFDNDLCSFTLIEKGIEGLVASIGHIQEDQKHLLPLDLELTDAGIIKWLENRVIPKNRVFVDEILQSLGLHINDVKGIIDVCKGLSLNDSYWVVPSGFDGRFSQYNLYENRFSEMLSLVAYTGIGQSPEAFTTSPELTTNGMLPKAWRLIENDGIYLYKGGTSGATNTGNEPYSEFYASQISKAMGLRAVEYDLENWKGILASKCRLFTDLDTSFVSIGRIVKNGGLKACLDYYTGLGKAFTEHVGSMLIFDAVIYNEDRHFGNFGVLRDNHSGKIVAPAPIFDNGLSLFNYAMPDDFDHLEAYARTRGPAYGNISFESICKEVMGKKQMAQLRKLIGFRFTRHPSLNLPEKRLQAIEEHIQLRIRQLMQL